MSAFGCEADPVWAVRSAFDPKRTLDPRRSTIDSEQFNRRRDLVITLAARYRLPAVCFIASSTGRCHAFRS